MRLWKYLAMAALSAGLVLTACPPAAAQTPGYTFVGLGDSYSSGTGIDGAQGECVRSEGAYGPLYAAMQPGITFRQAACSGADTWDVHDFQLRHLGAETRLVTITIGGNDAGFMDIVRACVGLYIVTDCLSAVDTWTAWAHKALPGLLHSVYREVHVRAPSARLVVLGYPRLFDAQGTCLAAGMPRESQDAVNGYADTLAQITSQTALDAGATWADVRGLFSGHGVCAADPWIVGLRLSKAAFHPNAAGHKYGYLAALSSAVPVSLTANTAG